MPLNPEVQQFLALVAEMGQPRLYTLSPEEARAQVQASVEVIGPGPQVSKVADVKVPVRDTTIAARVYEPADMRATIVWLHGGGWVVGNLESHDAMCRILANAAESRVVSVDYRLSPEHPFPVPLEDCWDALRWVAEQHSDEPLVVAGDSAGGTMAAVCALRARDRGGPRLALQVLIYPVTDHDMTTSSYVQHGGEDTMLGLREMEWFFDHYVANPVERDNPEVSPLRAADLSGLPPAIVLTDEYDPLRDEGIAYATRLREAGVPVTAHHYDDMIHAFFSLVNVFQRGNEAVEQVGRDIRATVTPDPVG